MERYAFYKDNKDGTWSAVIAGNVVDGCGEVLDARLSLPRDELEEWVRQEIGPTTVVYRQQ